MAELNVIHRGKHSETCRAFQAAMNRRLDARDLDALMVPEDGTPGPLTLGAARKAAWALGALETTYEAITREGEIPAGVQHMVRNPGRRSKEQKDRGERRIAGMRKDRAERAEHEQPHAQGAGLIIAKLCLQAAANYRANPGAYHYLAGGIANLKCMEPTPRTWRSDCSQFGSSIQNLAGLLDLGPNGPLWVNTVIMAGHLKATDSPRPGLAFGMYGPRDEPHHVEVFLGSLGGPGHEFVGHGSSPIDSLTPGRPDFYLANPGA